MALVPCTECLRAMSSTAERCPHCGAPNQQLLRRRKLAMAVPGFVVILAMVFVVLKGAYHQNSQSRADPGSSQAQLVPRTPEQLASERHAELLRTAVAICRQGSKQHFKDPDSVTFPQLAKDIPARPREDGTFVVRFIASAVNSFNARSQSLYECVAKPSEDGKTWRVLSLNEVGS